MKQVILLPIIESYDKDKYHMKLDGNYYMDHMIGSKNLKVKIHINPESKVDKLLPFYLQVGSSMFFYDKKVTGHHIEDSIMTCNLGHVKVDSYELINLINYFVYLNMKVDKISTYEFLTRSLNILNLKLPDELLTSSIGIWLICNEDKLIFQKKDMKVNIVSIEQVDRMISNNMFDEILLLSFRRWMVNSFIR